jgi:hypothetical protein
MHANHMVEKSL